MATVKNTSRSPPAQPAWRRRLGWLTTLGMVPIALCSLAGLAGRLWWGFDLANHFCQQSFWSLFAATMLLLLARFWKAVGVASTLLFLQGWLLSPYYIGCHHSTRPGASRIRVVTLNVSQHNTDFQRVLDFIRDSAPDVIVLEEIDLHWMKRLDGLTAGWPHRGPVAQDLRFGLAILSSLPLDEPRIEQLRDGLPVLTSGVAVGEKLVTVFGVHLPHPIPQIEAARQMKVLADLTEMLHSAPPPQIVLGDFDSTGWSYMFVDFTSRTGLIDTRNGFGVQTTWPAALPGILRIPIDHCLVSPNIVVTGRYIGPDVGSDHLPVVVDLDIQ